MILLMNMPKKLKIALLLKLLLVVWILIPMGTQVNHQLSDIPISGEGSSIMLAVYQDLLNNHLVMEHVFNVLIVYFVAVVVFHVIVQSMLHFKFKRYISSRYDAELSAYWTGHIDAGSIKIIVIDEAAFTAMAFGFWKRRIVISTGVLCRFTEDEINAILLHELFHCRCYHPLQSYGLNLLSKGLAFVPVIRDLAHYYDIWNELLADRYAMKRMNNQVPLVSVVLSLSQNYKQANWGNVNYFAKAAINYRIEQLINPNSELKIQITSRKTIIISALVLSFMTVFLFGYCF